MAKLLMIGPKSVHVREQLELVRDYFSEVYVVSGEIDEGFSNKELNFSLRNPIASNKTISELRHIIEIENPDIIHVHQANAYAYVALKAAKKTNVPVVVTAWGSDVLLVPKMGLLYRKMSQYVINHCDYFTVDSDSMKEAIKEIRKSDGATIINANFGVSGNSSEADREELIYSNRNHEQLYRINYIIKAFAEFVKDSPTWKLIIGGRGSQTDELKNLVDQLDLNNKVHFIGFTHKSELPDLYAKARVYVSIPESDGTSISLLEALMAGCYPVVSDLKANKEWIRDGENGRVVSSELREMFDGLADVDFEKAEDFNRELAMNRASKEVNKKKFFSLYDKMLSK